MDTRVVPVLVPNCGCKDWVKFNPSNRDFYRVHYPQYMIEAFIPAIKDRSMDAPDRVLRLMEVYMHDDEYSVWCCVNNCIEQFLALTQHTNYHERFKEFCKALFSTIRHKMKWDPDETEEEESQATGLLRSLVITRLIQLGDEKLIKQAKKKFQEKQRGTSVNVNLDLTLPMYLAVMSDADDDVFDRLVNLYRKEKDPAERTKILVAMGNSSCEDMLQRALDFSFTDDIRTPDKVYIWQSVSQTQATISVQFSDKSIYQSSYKIDNSPLYEIDIPPLCVLEVGRTLAWKVFKENFEKLKQIFGAGTSMHEIIIAICAGFSCPNKGKQIEKFFQDNDIPGIKATLDQAFEKIQITSEWLHRDYKNIEEFLDQLKICSCQTKQGEPGVCTCEFDSEDFKCSCKPEI
ncbi:puromycin-sensitive aminopeptidase-like [Ctenocephalides felis]|uniref:puromycin-sensitive aminopeptidase-like n=1 Tax=Ctenocephalides felis TaxID=7515 RepID=UPI000E6E33E3|nr:puromycin-sensitive aminopeptidase-like [Ctenocephalides felis]